MILNILVRDRAAACLQVSQSDRERQQTSQSIREAVEAGDADAVLLLTEAVAPGLLQAQQHHHVTFQLKVLKFIELVSVSPSLQHTFIACVPGSAVYATVSV